MRLHLEFEASDRAEVEYILGILGQHASLVSLEGLQPIDGQDVGWGEPPVDGAEPELPLLPPEGTGTTEVKRKRGRPKKEETAVEEIVGTVEADAEDPLGFLNLPADKTPVKPDANDEDFTKLTNPEKRDKGREILMDLIEADPTKKQAMQRLLKKYKVQSFKDIPDPAAAEFLADALLMKRENEVESDA